MVDTRSATCSMIEIPSREQDVNVHESPTRNLADPRCRRYADLASAPHRAPGSCIHYHSTGASALTRSRQWPKAQCTVFGSSMTITFAQSIDSGGCHGACALQRPVAAAEWHKTASPPHSAARQDPAPLFWSISLCGALAFPCASNSIKEVSQRTRRGLVDPLLLHPSQTLHPASDPCSKW